VPEAVVRVGKVALSKRLLALCESAPLEILVDRDGTWIDPLRSTARIITADPALTCREVSHRVVERPSTRWLDEWTIAEHHVRRALDEMLDSQDEITEPRVARDVAAFVPDGTTLVVGSSMPVRDLDWFMRPRPGLRCIANRGASGIDGFVSTTLGAAMATGRQTWALCGDLSLLHDQNGFASGLAREADAVFVVVNNDGGGIFSFLPQAELPRFEQVFATPHGLDFAKLAALYGCEHLGVRTGAELGAALDHVSGTQGVKIVEVRTDREANVGVHRDLWAAAAAALR
jgi:2-succinyl-5-enolpyruvyl-6-hydroxy-3-cyclohexene-1-carboxylate synthase